MNPEKIEKAGMNTTSGELADLRAALAEQAALIKSMQENTAGNRALALMAERTAPRENPDYNEVSVFTYPEGERFRPKPKLQGPDGRPRETFFCHSRCRSDELTPAEIDAFNKITSSKVVQKHNGNWTAEIRQNGSAQELHVDVPSRTMDDRMGLPSLLLILTEIEGGSAAVDPLAMSQRMAQAELEVEALKAQLAKVLASGVSA